MWGVRVKVVRNGGVQRAPVFEFETIDDACEFDTALNEDWSWLVPIMESRTSHGKVVDIRSWQMGRMVCVRISMDAGDALSQNMVSIASQHGVQELVRKFPRILRFRKGGGLSGEKVPSNINSLLGRGRAVTASVTIDGNDMRRITRADIADILLHQQNYSNFALWAGNQNTHNSLANTLPAMYIATGQDVGCSSGRKPLGEQPA